MKHSTTAELAARWFQEVWNDRNDATIVELGDPHLVGHIEDRDARGHDGIRQARDELWAAFPDFHLHIEQVIAHGEDVAARWRVTGTHNGNGFGVPATGTKVNIHGMTWLRFRNGRMVEGWDSWNQGAILQALQAAHLAQQNA